MFIYDMTKVNLKKSNLLCNMYSSSFGHLLPLEGFCGHRDVITANYH